MERWMIYQKKADFYKIAEHFHIDPVIARIMRNRDLASMEEMEKYLHGSRRDLYNPHLLKDGDRLVDILQDKIKEGKSIRVIGDYDIDGVMSSYILVDVLRRLKANVSAQIPDRMKDGYGLNMSLIEKAVEEGVDTIVTCDNGIAALEEIAYAKEQGLTVLVTDHHEIPKGDNLADAIVNPHQKDCAYPFKMLCGAGVAFKVMELLLERMNRREEIYDYLEYVAFATVGDVMDLVDENRILVKEGLKNIHETKNLGMKCLIEACALEQGSIEAYHFGFVLGPCINASGRLDTAKRALELFFQTDEQKARRIASELVELNRERKLLTQCGIDEAKRQYQELGYENQRVLVIFLPEIHESVAGIVAGRIRECYGKPTIILTNGEDCVKGSGRSIEAYSMYEELQKVEDLFLKYGGHPMAAGLSMEAQKVDELRKRLNENCTLTEEELEPVVHIDVAMPPEYVTEELLAQFSLLAPFGKGNPKPVFAERGIRIKKFWIVGKNQNVMRLSLLTERQSVVNGIYFGDIEGFLNDLSERFGVEEVEKARRGQENRIQLSVVYYPSHNTYQGVSTMQYEIQRYL